jgi:hypothetical protein
MRELIRHILREEIISEMGRRLTTADFIERATKVHGDKYDYSKVDYENNRTPVQIICPTHGVFLQSPDNHMSGKGCKYCGGTQKSNTNDFIEKARKVHGDKYDYSQVKYEGGHTKVTIFCPIHNNYFEQTASSHLSGSGCKLCRNEDLSNRFNMGREGFIERAEKVHGDKYDYSMVVYKNNQTPVNIICKKHNTVFKQEPSNHLIGQGCPICNESKGEGFLRVWFDKNNVKYVREKKFDDCFTKDKRGKCYKLEFDFYLPDYNLCVEWDGISHFEARDFHGGEETFKRRQFLDKLKDKYCEDNNINLLRIPYTVKQTDKDAGRILRDYLKNV